MHYWWIALRSKHCIACLQDTEESREDVGLRLVSDMEGWTVVLSDERRRSFSGHRAQALPKDVADRLLEKALQSETGALYLARPAG
eukprot:g13446.t1